MSETASGVTEDSRADDRKALRAALAAVTEAINKRNWRELDNWLSPDVVITMIDQVSLHGREDLARYVESKLGQFSGVLADLRVDPVPDAPAEFYGDTAICTLSSADRFIFKNGKDFLVNNRYTATLIKQDGGWKLVALHGGANAFNNPISFQLNQLLTGGLAVAGVAGLLIGLAAGKRK